MVWLRSIRQWHRWLAPFVLLPLLLTVGSGVGYRLARDWAGFSRDQVHWLMVLHEGEWLGPKLEPVLVLLNGLGLLWMLITGATMLVQQWKRPFGTPSREQGEAKG
ncbi:PepSY domain-containing protein [Synechococcus sp. HK01-R]|uniref:PepSY domain-containing protein n=1 Tax=Synechococcus sp. HK01-R TaxID=2751171 RepID=UPI0016258F08|nr:PepSY domain-containing protein [Synechococcus sp. HK01-R]QNG26040.1 PepSY domain-containing protein [Synechococcus sp. HK01-R]